MPTQPSALRSRFLVAGACIVVLTAVYVQAVANARAFHSAEAFTHPWHDVGADSLLLALSGVCVALMLPLLRKGAIGLRILAAFFLAFPVWVLGHLIMWLFRVYAG